MTSAVQPDDRHGTTGEDTARQEGGPELALELLVHGVGGTTPQEMLDDPCTVLVTGDKTAGIYRRRDDADAESRPQDYRDQPVPEAYCWSNLTSGNGSRALWLLLLPFMVANLAHWMRPAVPPDRRGAAVRAYGVLMRLVSLSLTVLLVAAACEVALDLTAWQCAGTPACSREWSWLGFLSAEHAGWWSGPGRRLALAAVVPTALTGLLWWLSHRTWSAYESQPPPRRTAGEEDADAGARTALCLPGFWYGRRLVARLRAAHTAAGFLTVAAALAAAAARHDRRPGGSAVLEALGWALEATLAAAGVFVVWVVCRRGRSERVPDDTLDRAVVRGLPGTALAVLGLTALYAAWSRPGWTSSGRLPGNETFGVLALAQGTLVLAIAATAWALHRAGPDSGRPGGEGPAGGPLGGETPDGGPLGGETPDGGRPGGEGPGSDESPGEGPGAVRPGRGPAGAAGRKVALGGFGSAAVAMLACALGGVMSGGVAQRVADWLDGPGTPGMGDGPIEGPPVVLSWQAAVIPPLLVVLAVAAACLAVRTCRVRRREMPRVRRSHPGEPEVTSRTRRIAGTIARAELTDTAPWFVGATAAVTLLLGAGALLGAWTTREVPGVAADGIPDVLAAAAQTAQALGSWLVGLGFVLLITAGRRAYRDASTRRTIGILWDVGTFWPRAAHPFAPPCYAERAVPDLTWRIATWTQRTGGRLVISGHSQGSVLAAAAVWQLHPSTRRRVALLTYGSPLERLYGRWFPAYFGPGPLRGLHHELHSWRNLWRRTDPIGGPVLATRGHGSALDRDGRVDRDGRMDHDRQVDRGPLRDPLEYGRTAEHPLPAPILGHSDYQADPAFAEERAELLARIPEMPRLPAGLYAVPDLAGAGADSDPGAGAAGGSGPVIPGQPVPDPASGDRPPGQGSSGRSSG